MRMRIEETGSGALAISEVTPEVERKLEALRVELASLGSVVVAFSGGVDSAFVLKVAVDVLGDRVLALTARSASLMQVELEEAIALARDLGAHHQIVDTHELEGYG